MAVRFRIILIVLGINLGTILGVPIITTPEGSEYVIDSKDNLVLVCESEIPITWSYPTIDSEDEQFPTSINIDVKESRKDDVYVSKLEITNASDLNVGFYCCNETDNPNNHASVYLYVNDDEVLHVGRKDLIVVSGKQYSPLVIPCRPTSPTVDVKLYSGVGIDSTNEPIEMNVRQQDRTMWTFNNKIGFSLSYVPPSMYPTYNCNFERNTTSTSLIVVTRITQFYGFIHQPIVRQVQDIVYNVEHETLQLKCEVEVESGRSVKFSWKFNGIDLKEDGRKYEIYDNTTSHTQQMHPFSILTVYNITQNADQGNYTCVVADSDNTNNNSLEVSILEKGTNFLRLWESNEIYNTSCHQRCEKIVWNINVESYPPANITWYDNYNKRIRESTKYSIKNTNKESILIITNVTIKDRGSFTIRASNGLTFNKLPVFLDVTDKPTVRIIKDDFHLAGTSETIKCEVLGYPKSQVKWEFKPCTDNSCEFGPINSSERANEFVYISSVVLTSSQSGYIKCYATNQYGTDEQIAAYTVTDVKDGFRVIIVEDDVEMAYINQKKIQLASGSRVTFQCIAAAQNYSTDIKWYLNETLMDTINEYSLETSTTIYSTKRSFTLDKLSVTHSGFYRCQTERLPKGGTKVSELNIEVIEARSPKILWTNMNKSQELLIYPNAYNFTCKYEGVPQPSIIWLKDDLEFYPDNTRIVYRNNKQILLFTSTEPKDEGKYTCIVRNRIDSISKSATMAFSNKTSHIYLPLYIVLGILLVISIGIGIGLMVKIKKERELEKILRLAGLANFEKGAVECINPDLGIDDQAELLPYDKESWEIPKEQMKLGKQLGAGAFGVVMKAVIERYIDNETALTVAVKMVKKSADDSYLRALVSELKIMVHLGKHLNVVNLIGACTKHIAKRELYVVVEYCRFGNLHNYLLRHRENFINQIDPVTGKIDYNIGVDILSRSFSVSSSHSQEGPPKDMMDYRNNSSNNYNGGVQTTEVTLVSMSPSGSQGDEPLMSNNSIQPEWRTNYTGDYKGSGKPICTKDLLTWTFQVSRGMEYLASRKVLHGDLAARNILLAENNIVKICDFGLAKSMYKSDNYKKKGDGPLPIKWMAVESIRDKVFSTQSDVWSFGIVLWEFFSLAHTPYPGMEADERLFQKLVDGYRMDSPCYATKEIYTMMLNCWEPKPLSRPSFGRLSERIGNMLEDSVKKHYIDLNDPYLVMNTERFQGGHSDYLQMVSPPDFEKLSSPNYVNELPQTPNTAQSDYMPMKPGHIFSPREPDGEVFTFSQLRGKDINSPELAPMLRQDSDYETQPSSPNSPEMPSYANPSYNKLDFLKEKNIIVNTPDNYVNMPKNKSAIKGDMDGFAKDEVHYVNNVSRDWEKVQ